MIWKVDSLVHYIKCNSFQWTRGDKLVSWACGFQLFIRGLAVTESNHWLIDLQLCCMLPVTFTAWTTGADCSVSLLWISLTWRHVAIVYLERCVWIWRIFKKQIQHSYNLIFCSLWTWNWLKISTTTKFETAFRLMCVTCDSPPLVTLGIVKKNDGLKIFHFCF